MNKPKVAFICVHNSCRSQIAETLGRHLAEDVFESYSAGTELKGRIDPDAVRLVKELYHIDMEVEGQHSKLLSNLPPVDVVVTMGCNVQCPSQPCKWREDWAWTTPPASRTRYSWRRYEASKKRCFPSGKSCAEKENAGLGLHRVGFSSNDRSIFLNLAKGGYAYEAGKQRRHFSFVFAA